MTDFKGKMPLKFKKTATDEIILLHDFYFQSSESDAPKGLFDSLSAVDKRKAFDQFPVENYFSLDRGNEIIGFVGFFPDDDLNVNIFYVLSPLQRGKGYFKELLRFAIDHCQSEFSDFKNIRALTRSKNSASIKGLKSCSFIRRGQVVEEVQPDVPYEEYIYPIKS